MKELKVGERIILEVVEATSFSCQGCFFEKEGYACPPDYCYNRLDGKNVIFKEVKVQKKKNERRQIFIKDKP